jgi:uncharacterized lipoprotein YehR (DUF1307 family)
MKKKVLIISALVASVCLTSCLQKESDKQISPRENSEKIEKSVLQENLEKSVQSDNVRAEPLQDNTKDTTEAKEKVTPNKTLDNF